MLLMLVLSQCPRAPCVKGRPPAEDQAVKKSHPVSEINEISDC